jgi:hypothetical protein
VSRAHCPRACRRAVSSGGQIGAGPVLGLVVRGCQAATQRRTGRVSTPQAPAGPGPLPPADLSAGRPAGAAARRQGPPRAVGADGSPHPVSGRPDPGGDLGGRLWAALAGRHRRRTHPPSRPGPSSGGRRGPWHHPPLRGGRRARSLACIGAGDPGRELLAPARSAGTSGQDRPTGTQTRATWLAPLAALSSPPTAGRGPPPPPSPSSPPPGSQPGRRLRRAPADRRAGHWRPDRHHHPRCRSGAQPAAAAMAPHPPGPSVERQGRTGWHRRSPGGRARCLFHLPSLPATGPQTIWPPIPLLACTFQGHRDLVGAANIAATLGGGTTSATLPTLVEHRRAGIVPARRDRRRHLHDQRRRRSCLASGHPDGHKGSSGCHSPHATTDPASDEDQATRRNTANVA